MINRLPSWLKQELPSKEVLELSRTIRSNFHLNTVCHSAKCPNVSDCFQKKHLTFMILGDTCTRNCRFCAVDSVVDNRKELLIDKDEPERISKAVEFLGLRYVVVTSVTRDDLIDGGAEHFAKTITAIRGINKNIKIEVLIPDFLGLSRALEKVVLAKPDIISHNIETVNRLYPFVRESAEYGRSLKVLESIKLIDSSIETKSSIMLGLGEKDIEIQESLKDLREINCDTLVLGQYLRPSTKQCSVKKFYTPEEFKYWGRFAYDLGFKGVNSFPLARTSYLIKERQGICTM